MDQRRSVEPRTRNFSKKQRTAVLPDLSLNFTLFALVLPHPLQSLLTLFHCSCATSVHIFYFQSNGEVSTLRIAYRQSMPIYCKKCVLFLLKNAKIRKLCYKGLPDNDMLPTATRWLPTATLCSLDGAEQIPTCVSSLISGTCWSSCVRTSAAVTSVHFSSWSFWVKSEITVIEAL